MMMVTHANIVDRSLLLSQHCNVLVTMCNSEVLSERRQALIQEEKDRHLYKGRSFDRSLIFLRYALTLEQANGLVT